MGGCGAFTTYYRRIECLTLRVSAFLYGTVRIPRVCMLRNSAAVEGKNSKDLPGQLLSYPADECGIDQQTPPPRPVRPDLSYDLQEAATLARPKLLGQPTRGLSVRVSLTEHRAAPAKTTAGSQASRAAPRLTRMQ